MQQRDAMSVPQATYIYSSLFVQWQLPVHMTLDAQTSTLLFESA
jgi:hypothetical protein